MCISSYMFGVLGVQRRWRLDGRARWRWRRDRCTSLTKELQSAYDQRDRLQLEVTTLRGLSSALGDREQRISTLETELLQLHFDRQQLAAQCNEGALRPRLT